MTETFIIRESKVMYKKYKKVKSLKMNSPASVFDWFKKLSNENYEKMISVYFNASNEVISFTCESEGEIDQAVVYPRKICRNALLNNACRIIFVHNHPSGNATPSEHDIEITKKLKEALGTIDIEVLDHIIIGDGYYYSFKEHGLI